MRSMALKMGMKTNIWLILSESWLSISKQSKVLWTRTVLKQWRLVAICCYLKVLRLEAWAAHFALFCWSAEFCKIAIDYWCFVVLFSLAVGHAFESFRVYQVLGPTASWVPYSFGASMASALEGECDTASRHCKQTRRQGVCQPKHLWNTLREEIPALHAEPAQRRSRWDCLGPWLAWASCI